MTCSSIPSAGSTCKKSSQEPGKSGTSLVRPSPACVALIVFSSLVLAVLLFFDASSVPAGKYTYCDSTRLCKKVIDFDRSPADPDVILLGSSISLTPALRADRGKPAPDVKGIERKLMLHDYAHCRVLEKAMGKKTGRSVSLSNLSLPAAMVSDLYLILRSALVNGKRPALVIIALAPRSFVSNIRKDLDDTYIHRALGMYDDLEGNRLADSRPGRALIATWSDIEHRGFLFQNLLKSGFSRLMNEVVAFREYAPAGAGKRKKSYDKDKVVRQIYTAHYNPPNFQVLGKQSRYFEALLSLRRKYGFELCLVEMPLRSDHLPMVPPLLLSCYRSILTRTSARYGARLLAAREIGVFHDDCFFDICHLNVMGARRFFSELAGRLEYSPRLARSTLPTGSDRHHK